MWTLRIFTGLFSMCGVHVVMVAQADTIASLPWVGREYQHWSGLPMMHGPNGECIAGYTEEESRLFFFADGAFQQITFEDVWSILYIGNYGVSDPCEPLEGDTLSMQSGSWVLMDDTLRVTVERTGLYAYEPFISEFIYRRGNEPFVPTTAPVRTCTSPRERLFHYAEEKVEEGGRTWH